MLRMMLPVVEGVNILVCKIQSVDYFPCGRTFSEDLNSSKKLGSSSVPSWNLHAFPYFFHRQSSRCCFTVISFISDPKYATSIRCRCTMEDMRRIRDIIRAKEFIHCFRRHTIDDLRRIMYKKYRTIQPLFRKRKKEVESINMCYERF
ncbi:uncharacterized protein LOC132625073 [Lycium barbarum]|uniref:uncharacterized protein LOC132625073 n=1 Tax=Lycium barbarum TaxID=112863 RepID=UPI00293F504F|nr:uncharacterized protein LOC132625073 [Lycium barbarum]